jgi:photosystem II stability/assembly factor-like uncharacterized protein
MKKIILVQLTFFYFLNIASATPEWNMVSIPGIPEDALIATLWAKQKGKVFVAVNQYESTDSSKVTVYYYNGVSWNTQLQLLGGKRYVSYSREGGLFGTSENDIFMNVRNNSTNLSEVYHYNGSTWQQQSMPAELGNDGLGNFVGETNNVYVGASSKLFRYNGTNWVFVTNAITANPQGATNLIYINANEIYALDCWGHALWNGTAWTWYQSFDFCDVGSGWGLRDASNNLCMFITGANNNTNGIRVWRFIESSTGSKIGSWGSKYDCTYLCDPSGTGSSYAGGGNEIWGSGPNDIYVIGHFGHPYNPTYALRIYHSDGTYPFTRMTVFDSLFLKLNANDQSYLSITGTGPHDVWISVGNQLAHKYNSPSVPQNLTATAGNGQVTLKWRKNTETDFLKYRVYMGTDSVTMALKDSTVGGVADTAKTITGLSNGTKYSFRVSALDSARLESSQSIAVSATPATTATTIPTISDFNPKLGSIGTTVTITGANFSTTTANNIVYFGAVKANVTAATSTSLTVTVPIGATYQPITVTVNGLTAYSSKPFIVTFAGGGSITSTSFTEKNDFASGGDPYDIAISDVDGDGKIDVAIVNEVSFNVSIFRNISTSGGVNFANRTDLAAGAHPFGVAFGDIDGDGKPDLAEASWGSSTVSIFRNTSISGSVSFDARIDIITGSGADGVAIGDLDADGKPDVVVTNAYANTMSILKNISTIGNISFAAIKEYVTGEDPYRVSIGDIDGDGKPDIAVANITTNNISIFRNISTGSGMDFAPKIDISTGSGPVSVAIGDLDGDGKPDIAVANVHADTLSILQNTSTSGNVNFGVKVDYAVGYLPHSVAIGDLDGDGKPDLVLPLQGTNFVSVFKNTSTSGNINFAANVDFPIGLTGTGAMDATIGDIDGDGKPDMIIPSSHLLIFRNTIVSSNTAPAAPTSLAVYGQSTSDIFMKWTASATGSPIRYRIYRYNGTTYTQIDSVNSTQLYYVDHGLTSNTFQTYKVSAVNVYGESPLSDANQSKTFQATLSVPFYRGIIPANVGFSYPQIMREFFGTVWATGTGYVAKANDVNLSSWSLMNTGIPLTETFYAMDFPSSTVGFVGSDSGTVLKTIDGGRTWSIVYKDTATTKFINYIKFFDVNNGIAMGDGYNGTGTMAYLVTTNGGATWANKNTFLVGWSTPVNVCFPSASAGYMTGYNKISNVTYQGIWKTTNLGSSWTFATVGTTSADSVAPLNSIVFADNNTGLATKSDYSVWKSTNGGINWTKTADLPKAGGGVSFVPGTTLAYIVSGYSMVTQLDYSTGAMQTALLDTTTHLSAYHPYFSSASRGFLMIYSGNGSYFSTVNVTANPVTVPVISSFSQSGGASGTAVTIIGTNFGSTQGTSVVKFGTTTATPTSWSNTQIIVPVPSGVTGSVTISITVNSQIANSYTQFTVSSGDVTPPYFTTSPYVTGTPVLVSANGQVGSSPQVSASASDGGSGIWRMQVAYRNTSEQSWSHSPYVFANTINYQIPATEFTYNNKPIGVNYRVGAWDIAGNVTWSPFTSIDVKLGPQSADQSNFNMLPAASQLSNKTTAYRMISVPYDLLGKQPVNLLSNFGDHKENNVSYARWRFQRYFNGQYQDYDQFSTEDAVIPGAAFFFIVRDQGTQIAVKGESVVRSDTMYNNGISLQNKWNLVGNPFNIPYPIDSLEFLVSGVRQPIRQHAYYSGTGSIGGWDTSSASVYQIKPWEGVALYVNNAGTLKFPSTGQRSGLPKTSRVSSIPPIEKETAGNWTLAVNAYRSDIDMRCEGSSLGMAQGANEGDDPYDSYIPPIVGDKNVAVYFKNADGAMMRDIRPPNENGDVWEMRVVTGDAGAKVKLQWGDLLHLPNPAFEAYLIDTDQKIAHNLKEVQSLEINSGNGMRNFRVVVGKKSFVEGNNAGIALVPSSMKLYANYPNPFNPETVIRYTVPDASASYTVTLKIFNVLGQEIATLVNEQKSVGYYEVKWNALQQSSGIYFYQLSITDGSKTFQDIKKMVLMK